MSGAICGKQSERYSRPRLRVAPNQRLKLPAPGRGRKCGLCASQLCASLKVAAAAGVGAAA